MTTEIVEGKDTIKSISTVSSWALDMYHICAVGRCDKNCNDTWVPPAHYDMKLYSHLVRQMTWFHNAADYDNMFNKPENEIKNNEYKRAPISDHDNMFNKPEMKLKTMNINVRLYFLLNGPPMCTYRTDQLLQNGNLLWDAIQAQYILKYVAFWADYPLLENSTAHRVSSNWYPLLSHSRLGKLLIIRL